MTPEEKIRRALLVLEAALTNSEELWLDEATPSLEITETDLIQMDIAVKTAVEILKGTSDE